MAPGYLKDGAYYFEDGSVTISVAGTLFRVCNVLNYLRATLNLIDMTGAQIDICTRWVDV